MKNLYLSALAFSLFTATMGAAEPGRFGVGMEGTPNGASPSLRVNLNEAAALNLNAPGLDFSKNASATQRSFRASAAVLPLRRSAGAVKHGPRIGFSGAISHYDPDGGSSETDWNLGLNAGWDLEYFGGMIPGLSVGGNVAVGYSYHWYDAPFGPGSSYHGIATLGNNLNLRYYF